MNEATVKTTVFSGGHLLDDNNNLVSELIGGEVVVRSEYKSFWYPETDTVGSVLYSDIRVRMEFLRRVAQERVIRRKLKLIYGDIDSYYYTELQGVIITYTPDKGKMLNGIAEKIVLFPYKNLSQGEIK